MKTILSSQTVDIPDKGKKLVIFVLQPTRVIPSCLGLITYVCSVWLLTHLFLSLFAVLWHSRGEVEGADSDCQGTPWKTHQGVQPHQPGAQPSGQETEEGKEQELFA